MLYYATLSYLVNNITFIYTAQIQLYSFQFFLVDVSASGQAD